MPRSCQTMRTNKKKAVVATLAPLLLLIGLVPFWSVGYDFPLIEAYDGFDRNFPVMVFFSMIGSLFLGVFTVAIGPPFLFSWVICVATIPAYFIAAHTYFNGSLDTSEAKSYLVTLSNIYSSARPTTCEVKGFALPDSTHRFTCGRGRFSENFRDQDVVSLLGKKMLIDVKEGYWGNKWVYSIKILAE